MKKLNQILPISSLSEFKAMMAKELKKYPSEQAQSAVFAALQWVQDKNGGYLTKDLMNEVADYLKIPPITVYEVASFYSLYDLEPVGRHKIAVCNSIACMLCGSEALLNAIKKKYDVSPGQTTKDQTFTLKESDCLGACINAPVVSIDKKYYKNLTFSELEKIIEELE